MSERQIDYVDDSGNVITTLTFAEGTTNEEINEYVSTYADEIETAAGVREPGFGPLNMGLVPDSFERGLYSSRQIAGALGSELGLLDPKTVQEDYNKMERYKQYSINNLDKEEIGDLETVRKAFQDSEKATGGAIDTVSSFFAPFLDNPDALGPLIGETLGVTAPAIAITAAGTMAGGYPGLVIAGFLGSAATEYGATFTEAFQEAGVDVNDNEAVLQVLSDPEKLDEVRKEASIRGVTVGTFDALTLGFAGKLSKLIKGNVSDPKLLGRAGAGGAAEFTLQAAGGAGGEATSQALTGRYEPGEIITEALVEGVTTPVDIALAARARGTNKTKAILEGSGLTPTAIREFDSKPRAERARILNDLIEGDEAKVVSVQKELNMTEDEIIAAKPFLSQAGEDVVASEFIEEKIIKEDKDFNPADIEGLEANPSQTDETLVDENTTQLESNVPSPRGAITRTEIDGKVIEKQVDSEGRERIIEKIKAPSVQKSQASTILEGIDSDSNQSRLDIPESNVKVGIDVTNDASTEAVVDAHLKNTTNSPVSETVEGKATPVITKLKKSVQDYNKAVERLDRVPLTAPRRRAFEKGVDKKAQQIKEDAQKAYPYSPDPLTNEEVNQVQQAVDNNQPLPTFTPKRKSVKDNPDIQKKIKSGTFTYGDADVTDSDVEIEREVHKNDLDNQTKTGESPSTADVEALNGGPNPTREAIDTAQEERVDQTIRKAGLSLEEAADKSSKFSYDPYSIKQNFIDLSLWDFAIKFPDMLAKKYPAFAPLFNAIKLRSGIVNTKMAEILQPFEILKDFSRQELHSTLKAVVVLDQLGSITVDQDGKPIPIPYAGKNGALIVEEVNSKGNFVIRIPPDEIIKANNLDMSILEDPTTGSGLLEVVTAEGKSVRGLELTEKELKGVQNIFEGMKIATEGVVKAAMPEFNFTSHTTVGRLTTLINNLKTIKNNSEAFSAGGLTEADAARQVAQDSGLVVDINDTNGAFKEGSSIDTMIESLENFRQMLIPIQANPFYIPHRRPGRIGVTVKDANGNTLWMQSVDLKELRKTLKLNLPFDQGSKTSSIPLSKTPTNIKAALQSSGVAAIKKELRDKVDAGVFGDKKEGITVEAFDMHENKFANALSLKDVYAAENVFETILSSMALNPEDGVKAGTAKQEQNKQFNEEFKKILSEGKKRILASGRKGVAPENQIRRKNIPGWIRQENLVDHLLESLTVHAARSAGYIGTQKTETILQKGLENLASLPRLYTYGQRYKDSVDSGAQDFAHMRRIAFHYFLGLNPASAFVNLTQIPMSAFPYIAHHSSGASASREILAALRDAGKIAGLLKGLKRTGSGTVSELIEKEFKDSGLTNTAANRKLWEDLKVDLKNGRLMAQVTAEQMGLANFGAGQVFKSTFGRMENISSSIFTYAELINRLTSYIAAHRTYTKSPKFRTKIEGMLSNNPDFQSMRGLERSLGQNISPARLFAAYTVDQTQFYMGVENRPEFMRGPVFGVVTQFMQFPARYLQMITNLAFDAQAVQGKRLGQYKDSYIKERAGALASMAAFMMFTGGFWSLPLAQQGGDAYDLMYKMIYGVDPVIRAELQKQLMELGIDAPEYFTRGVLPQLLNISLVNRTGAGVVIQPEMFSGDYTKAWGPAGSMIFGSMSNAVINLHRGDYTKAFANIAPTSAYNIIKGITMGKDGYSTTNRGRMTSPSVDVGPGTVAAQIVGFGPENISASRTGAYDFKRILNRSNELSQAFRDQLKSERSKQLYQEKIFNKTGSREARRKALQHSTNFNAILKDIQDYNADVLADPTKDSTYLVNLTMQTLKSITKNAAADAGLIYVPGPRKSRDVELNNKWYSGSAETRRELEKRFGAFPK